MALPYCCRARVRARSPRRRPGSPIRYGIDLAARRPSAGPERRCARSGASSRSTRGAARSSAAMPATLGAVVAEPPQTPRPDTTLERRRSRRGGAQIGWHWRATAHCWRTPTSTLSIAEEETNESRLDHRRSPPCARACRTRRSSGCAVAEAQMPPYMESFLAHLRLLIGVPFDYLVPDARLLPPESIRFFYLDRSWTDRLVDGADHGRQDRHARAGAPSGARRPRSAAARRQRADRARAAAPAAGLSRRQGEQPTPTAQPADIVTGFMLRSAAVSGWPHMDVRAFSDDVEPGLDPSQIDPRRDAAAAAAGAPVAQRADRAVPRRAELVWCEEPHHGVQFGVQVDGGGRIFIPVRDASGHLVLSPATSKTGPAAHANRRPARGRRRAAAQDIMAKDQAPTGRGGPRSRRRPARRDSRSRC